MAPQASHTQQAITMFYDFWKLHLFSEQVHMLKPSVLGIDVTTTTPPVHTPVKCQKIAPRPSLSRRIVYQQPEVKNVSRSPSLAETLSNLQLTIYLTMCTGVVRSNPNITPGTFCSSQLGIVRLHLNLQHIYISHKTNCK